MRRAYSYKSCWVVINRGINHRYDLERWLKFGWIMPGNSNFRNKFTNDPVLAAVENFVAQSLLRIFSFSVIFSFGSGQILYIWKSLRKCFVCSRSAKIIDCVRILRARWIRISPSWRVGAWRNSAHQRHPPKHSDSPRQPYRTSPKILFQSTTPPPTLSA